MPALPLCSVEHHGKQPVITAQVADPGVEANGRLTALTGAALLLHTPPTDAFTRRGLVAGSLQPDRRRCPRRGDAELPQPVHLL
jgi:hypothetical protein